MKRRKIIPDPVLMVISILGIAAFLIYWLTQNYDREKKSLAIKTEAAFRETILHLQVAKLKLDGFNSDSLGNGKVKIFINDGEGGPVKFRFKPKEEIISTINVIRDKLKDSLKNNPNSKNRMIISMNTTSVDHEGDTIKFNKEIHGPEHDRIFNLLYGVDSLQDSLNVKEITKAYSKTLERQKLEIPFTVLRLDSADASDERIFNEVKVGFAKPITYRLKLGNTFPYLIRRISLPVLFSVLLLGITILSFVLLYKNALKQRRLADLKNEFISNITHELKTPIATVGVAIEALKNFNAMQNPERTKEYLDISSNELQRLGMLVDKVLKLSMFEKKEIELRYETFNLKEVADEVLASLRLQLEKYHAKVEVTNEGDLYMQGDRLHMQSVIFNLLDNALKYSKDEPSIRVTMQEKDNAIVLSVADNGIGIPTEYKDKVFDKFFRIPHGDTHNAKGYGLGLSYAAQVIIKHNGTIAVESEPGNGTKFTITLPKEQA
jgi:two-component system phosphate regulon sensor histidine kinase PhoR